MSMPNIYQKRKQRLLKGGKNSKPKPQISRSISVKCRIWSVIHVQDELLHLLKILFNWSTMNILCFLTIRCISYDNIRSFLASCLAGQIFLFSRTESGSGYKRANYFFYFKLQKKIELEGGKTFFDETRISIRGKKLLYMVIGGGWWIMTLI
jgi:hypothetical protein